MIRDYELGEQICNYIVDNSLISYKHIEDNQYLMYFTQSTEEQIGAKILEILKLRRKDGNQKTKKS